MDAREARQAVDGQAANGPLSPAALLRMREQLALTPDQLRRLETMQAELGGILTPPQRAQIEQRLRTRRVTERRAGQQFPPDRQGAADRRGIGRGAPSPMERAAMRRAIERRMSAGARPGARPGMVMQREMETGPGMRPAGVGRGMGPGMRPGMGPRMGHGMGRNIGPAPRRDPRQRDDRDRDRGRDRNRRG